MVGQLIRALLAALFLLSAVSARPVERRLTVSPNIFEYIGQVKSALYVINSLKADNASVSCADTELLTLLYAERLDGDYAQQLLCEAAVGIQIFSDLDAAASDVTAALNILNSLQSPANSLSRLPSYQNVNVDTLDEAGLDGAGIQDVIYRATVPAAASSGPEAPSLESKSTITKTLTTAQSATATNAAKIKATTVFSNTGTPRNSLPLFMSIVSSAPSEPQSTVSVSSGNTSVASSLMSPVANISTSLVLGTEPVVVSRTPFALSGGAVPPSTISGNLTLISVTLSLVSTHGVSATAPTAVSGNISSIAGTARPYFYNTTTSAPTTTESALPVIKATVYTTLWVVDPPVSASNSLGITQGVTTLTIDITTTETILLTTTVVAQTTIQPYASCPMERGLWMWTGTWQPYVPSGGYGRPTASTATATATNLLSSRSGVMKSSLPYGHSHGPAVPQPLETETCVDGW